MILIETTPFYGDLIDTVREHCCIFRKKDNSDKLSQKYIKSKNEIEFDDIFYFEHGTNGYVGTRIGNDIYYFLYSNRMKSYAAYSNMRDNLVEEISKVFDIEDPLTRLELLMI